MNIAIKPASCKRATVALCSTLIGILGSFYSHSALAVETSAPASVGAFQESNAIKEVLCITVCNEFFEGGQASFESEIRRLQNRAARVEEPSSLLQVDPELLENLESERDVESR